MGETERLKILIAEDDNDLLALYDISFSDLIFEKRLVRDGKAAVEVYKNWHPDIIVLDIIMPVKTGCLVLEEIREVFGDKDTTIIFSTSIDDMDVVSHCARFGIQGYIVKPFNYKMVAYEILEFFKKTEPKKANMAQIRLQNASRQHLP